MIACNAVKCATMFWLVVQHRDPTFITFGDAIADWLETPDQATTNCCAESVRSIVRKPAQQLSKKPRPIDPAVRHWRFGVSKRRWIATTSLLTLAVLASCVCLSLTLAQMRRDTADSMVSLGFGAVNSNMLLNAGTPQEGSQGLVSSVLLSNLPQMLCSFVYLSVNALLTCMLLANEYSGYEVRRKALRVTTPYGQQRTTYWLQVPYAYGVPLIAASATLHWLISQAVFLVRVEQYDRGRPYVNTSAVGLSPAPMLVVVGLGSCITVVAVAMGFRKLEGKAMPVAASCSLALAAAAHRPEGDGDAAVLPVKWGEVVEMGGGDLGHCCFTSYEVDDVVPGRKYA